MKVNYPSVFLFLLCLLFTDCSDPTHPVENEIEALFDQSITASQDSIAILIREINQLSEANDYPYGVVKAKILAGYYYWNAHFTDTADLLLSESIRFIDDNNRFRHNLDHGRALLYLGMVNIRGGNFDRAKENAAKALEIFEKNDHLNYIGKALNILGSVEFTLGNYLEALEYFFKAREKKEEAGGEILSELANIANVYSRMEQYDEALTYNRISLTQAIQMNRTNTQINILNSIGTIHANTGRQDSAIFYYNLCKKTAQEIGNSFMEFLSNSNLANAYSILGEVEKSNKIISQELNDMPIGFEGTVNFIKAKNHLKLNEFDSAILISGKNLRQVKGLGQKQSIANLSEILMKSFEKTNQFDSALHYSYIHYSIKDSILNQDVQKKFSDLRVKIETIEKQGEIDVLEREKKLTRIRTQGFTGLATGVSIIFFLGFKNYQARQRAREARLKLETVQLTEELDKKKILLSAHTLNMIHRNNGFEEIEEHLKGLEGTAKTKIKGIIKVNKALDKDWANFNEYFSQVHASFYKELSTLHENLSVNEKRLVALIKLNLSNREISSLMNIESKSITMAKYRLKKKLNLEEKIELSDYIQRL